MKRTILSLVLLALMGAAPRAPVGDEKDRKIAELERLVKNLKETNAALERKLGMIVQGTLQLRYEAAKDSDGRMRELLLKGPTIPPDAVPKGEGNVRHYVVPVGGKASVTER